MKSSDQVSPLLAVPVGSSPHIDVRSLPEVPSSEYVKLAEQALFLAIFSGLAVMAGSFAVQMLAGHF